MSDRTPALTRGQRRELRELIQRELGSAWDTAVFRGTNVTALREAIASLLCCFAKTEDVQSGRDNTAGNNVIHEHR